MKKIAIRNNAIDIKRLVNNIPMCENTKLITISINKNNIDDCFKIYEANENLKNMLIEKTVIKMINTIETEFNYKYNTELSLWLITDKNMNNNDIELLGIIHTHKLKQYINMFKDTIIHTSTLWEDDVKRIKKLIEKDNNTIIHTDDYNY